MKLSEALDSFLIMYRVDQTRETYAKFLRKFVASIGPDRPLDLIRDVDIDAYIYEMSHRTIKYADHPRRPTEETKLSSMTVYKNIKMIKKFFRWAEEKGYVAVSPAKAIVNRKPRRPLGLGKAIKDNEADQILAGAQFDPRNRAILYLLKQSGCRAGEAATLQLDSLDLEDHVGWVIGKGDKQREILFGPETAEAIRAWLAVRPKVKHNFVFTSTRSSHNPLTAAGVSQIVRRLGKKVGLERSLGAHSFRHRVGYSFSKQRVSVRVAQAYLGHTNPSITFEYYQDVDENDLREAERLLNGTKNRTSEEKPHQEERPLTEEEKRAKKKADEIIERFRRLGTS